MAKRIFDEEKGKYVWAAHIRVRITGKPSEEFDLGQWSDTPEGKVLAENAEIEKRQEVHARKGRKRQRQSNIVGVTKLSDQAGFWLSQPWGVQA